MSLDKLEEYFKTVELPEEIRLSEAETITDVGKFIEGHIKTLRGNSGNIRYLPYYERLARVREIIEEGVI